MAKEAAVPFDEFVSNLEDFFDRVVHKREEIIIEAQEGELAVLKPVPIRADRRRKRGKREITEADRQAFRASAGSWSDLDLDKFLADLYESRRISSRPPVEL